MYLKVIADLVGFSASLYTGLIILIQTCNDANDSNDANLCVCHKSRIIMSWESERD